MCLYLAGLLACALALGPNLTLIRLSIEVLLCLSVEEAGSARLGWMFIALCNARSFLDYELDVVIGVG